MDLDLRRVRYFLAVAEHLNFSRAAEDLYIAQPVLSRQIRVLEGELGADLFTREKKRTALTVAGSTLLEEAPGILAAAAALRRRVAVAARGEHTFTIGFAPGIVITESVRELRRRHPQLQVEVVRTQWDTQIEFILNGRIDVGYTRLPINPAGLQLFPLFQEPRLLILPDTHALAGRSAVRAGDLVDEHLLQDPTAVPEWRTLAREMRSSNHPDHRAIRTVEERLEMVAGGQGIMILPRSAALFYRRPGIATLPLADFEPNRVALAWDVTRKLDLFSEFAAIARSNVLDPYDDGSEAGQSVATAWDQL